MGQESMTAVLAPFFAVTLGAAPFALAGVEAAGRAGGALARLGGNRLADRRPGLRGLLSLVGNAGLALAASFLAASQAVWQAGACRSGSWVARGLGTPPLLEEASAATPAQRLGRRLGLERSVGAFGAAAGALAVAMLLAFFDVRTVILLALVPVVAAVVVSAVGVARGGTVAAGAAPVLPRARLSDEMRRGPLGTLLVGVALYEASNIAAVLLLLRATKILPDGAGPFSQLQTVAMFYGLYQLTAAASAVWAGGLLDRLGAGTVIAAGAVCLLAAYAGFAYADPGDLALMIVCFVLAGAAAGAVDAAEYTGVGRLASPAARRSAFGAVAGLQSAGRVIATLTAGGLWTLVGPEAGLLVCGPLLIVVTIIFTMRVDRPSTRGPARHAAGTR
jgi:MFS family permease